MTKTLFAAVMGVDRAQPTRWAQAGMPLLPDGRVDAVAAAAWVRANVDAAQRERRSIGAPAGLSPTQEFTALRVLEKRREMAARAGELLERGPATGVLSRLLTALRQSLVLLPRSLGQDFGLTMELQVRMRVTIEEHLRDFVRRMREEGLPTGPDDT